MRTLQLIVAISSALLLSMVFTAEAHADTGTASFNATVTAVSSSCQDEGIELGTRAKLDVSRSNDRLTMRLQGAPAMTGKVRRGGKFRLKFASRQPNAAGVRGNFSATGRVSAERIGLVLVVEYYKNGKAQCSQSWDIAGEKR